MEPAGAQFGRPFVCITSSWPSSSSGTKPLPRRRALLLIVRAFFNNTITIAVWAGFHVCLSGDAIAPLLIFAGASLNRRGTGYAKACGQSGQVSNFVQILLSNLTKQNGSKDQSQAPKCFASTLKIFADRVSSNRTDTRVGRRERTCVFKMRRSNPKRHSRAYKRVPDMRRRDHSCRRLNHTLCTPNSKFTATSVTDVGPSNPWLCLRAAASTGDVVQCGTLWTHAEPT